jgi:hypothetical protein
MIGVFEKQTVFYSCIFPRVAFPVVGSYVVSFLLVTGKPVTLGLEGDTAKGLLIRVYLNEVV